MADIQTHLRLGSLLHNGSYRIKKVLGQGGFGITYLATDLSLDRDVAIKEFFPKEYCERDGSTSHVTLGTQSNREFIEKLKVKFLKEARNIAKFDCPGIIKIYAAFEENGTAYYVMDYIEGASLSELIKSQGPLPVAQAKEYVVKVGEALEYVHSHHINHLDVKPANIMVRRRDHQPILIDFGLSKQYDKDGNQTSTTPVGISHGYAPIEQYNVGGVKEFTPKTDLYSLAATLYYIVSGETPQSAQDVFDEGLKFPAGFPSELMSVISKAMSPAKKHRHETVREFLMQLEGVGSVSDGSTTINSGSTRLVSGGKGEVRGSSRNLGTEFNRTDTSYRSGKPAASVAKKSSNNMIMIAVGAGLLVISILVGVWLGKSSGDEVPTENADTPDTSLEQMVARAQEAMSTSSADVPKVEVAEEEYPVEENTSRYPSSSAMHTVLSSPGITEGGSVYHYFKGEYIGFGKYYPIVVCFVTRGEDLEAVYFKNVNHDLDEELTVRVESNGDIITSGVSYGKTTAVTWYLSFKGHQGTSLKGKAESPTKTVTAKLSPTNTRYSFRF